MEEKVKTIAILAALLTFRYPGAISYDNRIQEAQELYQRAEQAVSAEEAA